MRFRVEKSGRFRGYETGRERTRERGGEGTGRALKAASTLGSACTLEEPKEPSKLCKVLQKMMKLIEQNGAD